MSKFDTYRAPDAPVPAQTLAWNMYGPGLENIGRDGRPEAFPVPQPDDDHVNGIGADVDGCKSHKACPERVTGAPRAASTSRRVYLEGIVAWSIQPSRSRCFASGSCRC